MSLVSSDNFYVDKARKAMVADWSDLSRGGERKFLVPAYVDSADAAIDIVSARTGKTVRFVQIDELRTLDGELHRLVFAPMLKEVLKNPKLDGWIVEVLND